MGARLHTPAGIGYTPRLDAIAGVAQLVERNLAKVEVASSRLVSRSRLSGESALQALPFVFGRSDEQCGCAGSLAGWQSGHAAACKAVDAGSIPTPASRYLYQALATY